MVDLDDGNERGEDSEGESLATVVGRLKREGGAEGGKEEGEANQAKKRKTEGGSNVKEEKMEVCSLVVVVGLF